MGNLFGFRSSSQFPPRGDKNRLRPPVKVQNGAGKYPGSEHGLELQKRQRNGSRRPITTAPVKKPSFPIGGQKLATREKATARIFGLDFSDHDPFALDNTYDGRDQRVVPFDGSRYRPPAPYHNGRHWVQPRPPNVLDATYQPNHPTLSKYIPHTLPDGKHLT